MSLPRLKRSTLGDDVYETLRSAVLEHTLKPGDRVNIDALARELEVSPTPVREALARLESEGLLRKRPLAGYTVSPLLTRREFDDMFDMRLLLECAAARWAASRATEAQRLELVTEAARTVSGGDDKQWHAAFTAPARCCATASPACMPTCICTGATSRTPRPPSPTPNTRTSPPPSAPPTRTRPRPRCACT
jgi:DNA-binding GntR family transcriptional regulator